MNSHTSSTNSFKVSMAILVLPHTKITSLKTSQKKVCFTRLETSPPTVAADALPRMGYPLFRCNHGHGLACRKGGQCYVDPESGEEAMTGPMQLRLIEMGWRPVKFGCFFLVVCLFVCLFVGF